MTDSRVGSTKSAIELASQGNAGGMFEQLFESFLQEVFIFHPKTLALIAVNRAARANLGLMDGLATEIRVSEFIAAPLASLLQPLVGGKQDHIIFSTIIRRRNGSQYPAEVKIQPVGYNAEQYCLALVNDLSKADGLEDRLWEKETTLNAVMDAVRDAVVMLDERGAVTYWNDAAECLFGFCRSEILGKDLHSLILSKSQMVETYHKSFAEFQASGKCAVIGRVLDLTTKGKGGREMDIELSLSGLQIQNSWHAIGIARDISQRKQSKRELENSRQKYLDLAENAPIGILSCDREGNITFVNQRVLDILGSSSIEETRKINLLTFPLLVKYGFSKYLAECLQKNSACSFELSYQSKWNKKVWLKVHTKPQINQDAVVGLQIIIDDISERKQLEEKLLNLSITDTLTDAYNRRYFIQRLGEEIDRKRRVGSPFSVIMADIDHFKNINDRFGHDRGDVVLKRVTAEMTRRIRKMDTLARWGGDEFMVLTAETTGDQARRVAERVRACLDNLNIPEVGKVTASFGVVAGNAGDTVDSIVQRVDNALYQAKSAGRNCVKFGED